MSAVDSAAMAEGRAGLTVTAARPSSRGRSAALILIAPAAAFLIAAFVVPVVYVLVMSVTEPDLSLAHFRRIFTVPLYLRILWNTFQTSMLVTLACLVLGYPVAYVMSRRKDWVSGLLFGIVAISFWTGFLVRTYAWLVLLGKSGPLSAMFETLGLGAPPKLLFTSLGSAIGMTHILLPFMILALYSVMEKIDATHLRAAESLGAPPFATFRHVFLPLSLPGVVNGAILVFTICLGFYVTPILLGTPSDMMISQLVNQQIEELLNWGFAAALAVVLLVSTVFVLAIYDRFFGLDRLWG